LFSRVLPVGAEKNVASRCQVRSMPEKPAFQLMGRLDVSRWATEALGQVRKFKFTIQTSC
jgi:hypothetical protein